MGWSGRAVTRIDRYPSGACGMASTPKHEADAASVSRSAQQGTFSVGQPLVGGASKPRSPWAARRADQPVAAEIADSLVAAGPKAGRRGYPLGRVCGRESSSSYVSHFTLPFAILRHTQECHLAGIASIALRGVRTR
jgi:hypothetical protein